MAYIRKGPARCGARPETRLLFSGNSLKSERQRTFSCKAIRDGEQDQMKARLFQTVDGAVGQSRPLNLLQRRQLRRETRPEARVQELRLEMDMGGSAPAVPSHEVLLRRSLSPARRPDQAPERRAV